MRIVKIQLHTKYNIALNQFWNFLISKISNILNSKIWNFNTKIIIIHDKNKKNKYEKQNFRISKIKKKIGNLVTNYQ